MGVPVAQPVDDAPEPEPVVEILPWTESAATARFLTRWCHRAMGDREMAEQELAELIALAAFERYRVTLYASLSVPVRTAEPATP